MKRILLILLFIAQVCGTHSTPLPPFASTRASFSPHTSLSLHIGAHKNTHVQGKFLPRYSIGTVVSEGELLFLDGKIITPSSNFLSSGAQAHYQVNDTSITGILGLVKAQPTSVPILIVFSGESNSGGQALNSGATSGELAPRPEVQILNNTTLTFEDLDIGTNNMLGHVGFNSTDRASYHGWELELANQVAAGNLQNPVYLAKTGQGGSRIDAWAVGGTYSAYSETIEPWTAMQERVDTAIAQIVALTGQQPKVYLFYSQGINDILASVNGATWKAATLAHFDKIDVKWGAYGSGGKVPKFMTNFYTSPGDEAYNTLISEIADEREDVWLIHTSGQATQDGHHWSYSGMKGICQLMVNALNANL